MRNRFIEILEGQAKQNHDFMILTADLGFSVFENFRAKYPTQFLNVGIAEQNMIGLSAGIALTGKKIFTYSIGNFSTLRPMEQIRYDICYNNLNVCIVSVGSGFAYGSLGTSHHATEDFAMMRSLPNLTIFNPADKVELELCMDVILNSKHPSFLRLNKNNEPSISSLFNINHFGIRGYVQKHKIAVVSTGAVSEKVSSLIKDKRFDFFSVFIFNNQSQFQISSLLCQYDEIITVEENQLSGGFGSFILEGLNDQRGKKTHHPIVKRFGIDNEFISIAGTQDYLREHAFLEKFKFYIDGLQ